MRSSAGTNQAIINVPLSRRSFAFFSPCPHIFFFPSLNHMAQINEARRYSQALAVPSPLCTLLGDKLRLFHPFALSFSLRRRLFFLSFFPAHVSQLRNCLHPTQSGAGLKFPIGYVPICREHTSTDAIREQAYELPGSLPSPSSDRMALIPDYDPNNNTTTT